MHPAEAPAQEKWSERLKAMRGAVHPAAEPPAEPAHWAKKLKLLKGRLGWC